MGGERLWKEGSDISTKPMVSGRILVKQENFMVFLNVIQI